MKIKKRLKSLFVGLILLLEVCIVAGVFILNYLTTVKGGVMRHIYSRRIQYEQSIYSENLLSKQSVLGILSVFIFSMLLIYATKKHKSKLLKAELTIGIIASALVPIVINSNFFINMMSYPYFIMASQLILLIQLLIVLVLGIKEFLHSKQNKK